jgi:D-alanine-D-alanine ligase
MKILVLAGGYGSERDVSLSSGKRVAEAFCRMGYETALEDPTQEISLYKKRFSKNYKELKRISSVFNPRSVSSTTLISSSVISLCKKSDLVFIMLHGGIGESGRLQALLDCLNVKYSGSPCLGSAMAMNKLISKRIFESAGILTPAYTVYNKHDEKIPTPPRYPCVVKPLSEGSSFGVSIVKAPGELDAAIGEALKYEDTVLIEAVIKGREITVGILDDTPLAVTEIIPKDKFYDYESKYTEGKTEEITPADIKEEITKKALKTAVRCHKALGLSNFSRTDMIIEDKTELLYVLETNTVPGMTKTSLLPLAAEYRGISFDSLCKKMAGIKD